MLRAKGHTVVCNSATLSRFTHLRTNQVRTGFNEKWRGGFCLVVQLPDNNLLLNPHEVVWGAVLVYSPFKPQSLKCQVYDDLPRLLWVKMVNKG